LSDGGASESREVRLSMVTVTFFLLLAAILRLCGVHKGETTTGSSHE
jgi:hypothetical protein